LYLCFDVSCQASRSHKLVGEISKLGEIIYHLGISTNQRRKLLTFLPDMSSHQKLHIFIGQRSSAFDSDGDKNLYRENILSSEYACCLSTIIHIVDSQSCDHW
jgi:hypothetical protein